MTTTTSTCKPKICEVGGGGNILPLFGDTEQGWNKFPFRAILYLSGLLWFFMGVAIVSDIFMGAIERITSKKMRVPNPKTGKQATVKVWNDTVANLTLMALGSSAPEILLSVIELSTNDFISGDLGPSTIVGSAAFNLLCITAVCVYTIPEGEVRMIKDVGVFAVTAGSSIAAYLWLYFIVLVSSPDEITVWEGTFTFFFFPALVVMAFGADKGYFTVPGHSRDPDAPPRCIRNHNMTFLGTTRDTDGWRCDGIDQAGGCRSGITGYHQTRGVERYRCELCDYDLCNKCVECGRRLATHHVIDSDISKAELADIELRILQQHGDSISDEQLARLIQKEHAEPSTRATYRVAATRQMVGGKRVAAVEDNGQYSMSSVVPIDGSSNGEAAKNPVICPSGHYMHVFVTPKANFNCDICKKKFPAGTQLYGCRTCNTDACPDCKSEFVKANVTVEFCSASYAVLESVGTLNTHVQRTGDISQRVFVEYRTREGTAKAVEDYRHIEGRLEFDVGDVRKTVSVDIVDDESYEDDEWFFIDLFNPSCNLKGCKVALGENKTTTVSIIDDDLPGVLSFTEDLMNVTEGIANKVVTLTVRRQNGSSGTVTCKYTTEDSSARAGRDYLAVYGTLVFEHGQMSRDVNITVLSGHHLDSTQEFRVNLTETTGGATFDASTDGGPDSCVCTIVILSDGAASARVDRVMKVLMMDWEKAAGKSNWKDQFVSALLVNGGEDSGDASIFDWVMHIITVFWKVLFALIPPTDLCDGWLCFACSLAMIGLVTAFIGDMAGLLGCTLDVPDKITAITFVALGTSLPDTFASKTAAEQDPYADASIGNVTGSNSVNVFLGLGLPWFMGSIYWQSVGKTDLWRRQYSGLPDILKINGDDGAFIVIGGDLGFGVLVFSVLAMLSISALIFRRKQFGGELGGPTGPKTATAAGLVAMWFLYVGLSSWKIMSNRGPCD